MICPLCGKEHDDPYILKLQKIVDQDGNKEEIIKVRICLNCEYHLFAELRKSAKQVRNEELRAKSENDKANIEELNILGVDYSEGKDITVVMINLADLLPDQREQLLSQVFDGTKEGIKWPPSLKQPTS